MTLSLDEGFSSNMLQAIPQIIAVVELRLSTNFSVCSSFKFSSGTYRALKALLSNESSDKLPGCILRNGRSQKVIPNSESGSMDDTPAYEETF